MYRAGALAGAPDADAWRLYDRINTFLDHMHVLRNSLIPVVTVVGLHLGHLLGGAFVVESIFGWPRVGRLAVQAIFDRDTPVVLGATLTVAALYLAVNLGVDIVHGWLDPQVAEGAI